MKRFIGIFLISLYLTFNVIGLKPAFAINGNLFSQGIYKSSDLNISKSDSVHVLIFDKDYIPIQNIRLTSYSLNIDTIPMMPEYLFVVTGNGEVTVTTKPS